MAEPAVLVEGAGKSFGANRALDDVTLHAYAGELSAVMGENGAGKSTLMKILAGLQPPDQGRVVIHGEQVRRFEPAELLTRHRVALVPQELALCRERTVAENVLLGTEPGRGPFPSRALLERRTAELLAELDLDLDPRTPVGRLDLATQQLVVIARSLARRCRVLILDEPTAMLTPAESERLFTLLGRLRGSGVALLYVSHRIPEVFALADRIHVLRDGRITASWRTTETTPDEVVGAMVGRELAEEERGRWADPAAPVLARMDGLTGRGFAGVSAEVRRGEVLGVAGLPDSGRTELLRGVFGADPLTGGSLRIEGKAVTFRSPAEAIRAGVAYVPAERRQQGILPTMSVADNIGVLQLGRASRFGLLSRRRLAGDAAERARRLRVKHASGVQGIGELSGGNQQKAVIARWLSIDPRLLLLDEPTRGIDVGAKAEIYDLLGGLAADGVAIVMSSSDLPELLRVCDRIAVMREGRLAGVLSREEATEEKIMAIATGVAGGEDR
ncbi:ribose transport system ATP-binding protein [Streptosporangium becharense]|uniref:Ribose transport system ATP-binding protein n=1 Tax=Streptosporangium becharense TaxID=1816182 RepID=A0A7W9IBD4_9ACTN|nr:sugar ABC transporter ATP-binding protein [Streptosporangium becharense]MBB2910735.1 ribose transport system ATP-binding protein [Streptosporangium becharense]MBB5817430.1 ribose transport system ATP-binding protein [Streptosporangium becharense]